MKENQPYQYLIETEDFDGDALQLSLVQGPDGMQIQDNTLSWMPDFTTAGEHTISLKVDDGDLHSIQTFTLNVINVNRAPKFASKPITIAHENVQYRYQLDATDADKEKLGLILLNGPEGMQLSADGLLAWKPGFEQNGEHSVKVSVSDGIDTRYQSFTVSVKNTNREPSLEKIANQHIVSGEKFSYQLQAWGR